MKSIFRHVIVACILLVTFSLAHGQDNTKISGLAYGDFYGILKNHDEDLRGENAFWFRRIYLTVDSKINDGFSFRIRFETNTKGDFTSKSKMEPFVKDAYLRWIRTNHSLLFGISSTPTWGVIEPFWGYRSVEKTPLDLYKFGSSRDFGIAFKGSFDQDKKLRYHVMLGNGNSTSSEVGQGKKVFGSLAYYPNSNMVLEGYADYDDRQNDRSRFTLQGFAGFKTQKSRIGLQFVHQGRRSGIISEGLDLQVFSGFVVTQFSGDLSGFIRYDRMFDPNPDGAKISYIPFDTSAKSRFFLAGLDIKAGTGVNIIPNIETVLYDNSGGEKAPDPDLILRLTFAIVY